MTPPSGAGPLARRLHPGELDRGARGHEARFAARRGGEPRMVRIADGTGRRAQHLVLRSMVPLA